jgi:hypothetical protein
MFVDPKKTNFDKFINYNFITKYLHNNKYNLLDKLIKKNFNDQEFSVLDIGSGLSNFYYKFNSKYNFKYLGIENSKKLHDISIDNFSKNYNFELILDDIKNVLPELKNNDLILCLDVLEHVNLNLRKEIISRISQLDFKKLFINVPNEFGPAILIKNFGSKLINYKRDFEYSFIETIYASLYMEEKLSPHTNKHKNFYWKNLYFILKEKFDVEIKTNFNNLLPNHFSPTISFICSRKIK